MNINLNLHYLKFNFLKEAIKVYEEYENCIDKIIRIGYTREDAIKFISENATHEIAFDNAIKKMWSQ